VDLFGGEASWDVLGAVPVECRDGEDEGCLDDGAGLGRGGEAVDEFAVLEP